MSEDAEQVGTAVKAPHDYLVREVTVTEPGYAFIFLSNENLTEVDVHFDDVKITHTHSNIVAGADYYPYGLVMDGREIEDEPYRWGYQGQFSEKDLTTGMQEFELRNYDARIGRWTTPDPYGQYASPYLGMGNLPHVLLDGNGGWAGCPPLCPETVLSATTAGSSIGTAMFGGQLAEIVIEGARVGTVSGILPSIVVSTMVEIPNGLMFQGIDKSWYATFPTNEGSYILKHQNGDWQMYRNEPYLAQAYGENLRTAHDKIAELYTTLISSALGGFTVSTGLRGAVTQNAVRGGGRVFWSGGEEAMKAAAHYAKVNGGKTLEMTLGGRVMTTLNPVLPRSISNPIWNSLSTNFAKGATGSVNVFHNVHGVRLQSIWAQTEYGILKGNSANIFYHNVFP